MNVVENIAITKSSELTDSVLIGEGRLTRLKVLETYKARETHASYSIHKDPP